MAKKNLASLVDNGKRLVYSNTAQIIGSVLLAVAVFAVLYLFLITGFALGMTM